MSESKVGGEQPQADDSQHWFAGRDVEVLLYRINRRSLLALDLFTEILEAERPEPVLVHLAENLTAFDPTAESGRRYKRFWRVGNVAESVDRAVLTGRLGWRRSGEALDTVLRHSSFAEKTLAKVLTELLNAAERERRVPTTDWDVEPIGDEGEFFEWVNQTDRVTSVEFVFKRPNPDAEDAFQELFARLDSLRAEQIREVVSTSDGNLGLDKQGLERDPVSRSFLAAAMVAFGYVVGRGVHNGRKVKYDQRSRVARERLSNVSPSWEGATEDVVDATTRARRRRSSDG